MYASCWRSVQFSYFLRLHSSPTGAYILFYFRRGASWFPLLNETISKVAKAETPKSVLNSYSISDESETSDKECQRTPRRKGQKPSHKKRKHDILDCSNPASVSSSQSKQDATNDPLPNLDMPSVSSAPSLLGAKRRKASHPFSPSTPTGENHTSENGTDSAFQEQPLNKSVPGDFKQTGENSSGQSRSILEWQSEHTRKGGREPYVGRHPYSFGLESEQMPKFYSNKRSNVKNTLRKKS